MKIQLVLYGIARDIIGASNLELNLEKSANVSDLLSRVRMEYPEFGKLTSLLVAVNDEYAEQDQRLKPDDEIVLIPPVSGG